MRPYLGILRDSFHEAFSSRVLWILLVLTTLFLLGLAPLGTSEQAGSYLGGDDILDRGALAKKLVADGQASAPSPGAHLWAQLTDSLQKKLAEAVNDTENRSSLRGAGNQLREELNKLFTRRDFFQAAAWDKIRLNREARDLLAKGLDTLPEDQLARFNRLALEAAFPDEIAASSKTQVQLTYLVWEFGVPLPISTQDLRPAINQILLAFMVLVLGVAGILVAILVTASIIPHTYEQGAIDLLLSKPVSRSLVFLTKFLGGCAFILINAAYLIGGLWLIVGWRFNLWNHKLLLCIPLFMFLFAIYYAVSALAGIIWKNAIVCVVMTIVFWGVCFAIGSANNVIEALVLNPSRINRLVPAGEALLAVSDRGAFLQWDEDASNWEPVFADHNPRRGPAAFGFNLPLVGPVYDAKEDRILACNQNVPQFAMFASSALFIGKPAEDWRRIEGVAAPPATEALLIGPHDEILAVGAKGVLRLEGNPEEKPKSTKVLGFDLQVPGSGARFVEAAKNVRFNTPLSAAMDRASGRIAVYDARHLTVLEPQTGGTYSVLKDLEFEQNAAGVVGLAGSTLMLVLKSGEVQLYDAATLEPGPTFEPHKNGAPRYVATSPDGRYFAVVFHDGWLWLFDAVQKQPLAPRVTGQGDISAATFTDAGRLLVADRLTRVTVYRLEGWQAEGRRQGQMDTWEMAYRYGIHPTYTLFPKPGALDNMVSYLLTDEKTVAAGPRGEDDLAGSRMKIDVWGPVWSNLAFLSVVLVIGCAYVARKDF